MRAAGVFFLALILFGNLAALLRISHAQESAMFELNGRLRLIAQQLSTAPRLSDPDSQTIGQDHGNSMTDVRLRRALAPAMREAVGDVLANELRGSSGCLGETTQRQDPESHQTEAIRAAEQEVDSVFAAAVDRGIWALDSATAFEIAVGKLPEEKQFEAYNKLAAALNAGRITLDRSVDPVRLLGGADITQ